MNAANRGILMVAAGMTFLAIAYRSKAFARFLDGTHFLLSEPSAPSGSPPPVATARPRDPRLRDFHVWTTHETNKSAAVVPTELETRDGILSCESRWILSCEESIDHVDKFGCKDVLPNRVCKGVWSPDLECENEVREHGGKRFLRCTRQATPAESAETDMVERNGCMSRTFRKKVVYAGQPFVPITSTRELLRVFPIRSAPDAEWFVKEFVQLERLDPGGGTNMDGVEANDANPKQTSMRTFDVWVEHEPICGCDHNTSSLRLRVSSEGTVRYLGKKVVKLGIPGICFDDFATAP